MTSQPDLSGPDLATINAALSFAIQCCIESMGNPDPKLRRGVDFDLLDRATEAADRLVATHGPDAPLPMGGALAGATARGLVEQVRYVVEAAAPYRPKGKRP